MTQVNGIKAGETKQTLELKAKQEIAHQDGRSLFSALRGNTNKEEQKTIIEIIKKTDAKDIGHLLKGYSKWYNDQPSPIESGLLAAGTGAGMGGSYGWAGAGVGAVAGFTVGGSVAAAMYSDKIFEQIDNEYFFPEKKELMMDLTKKCHEYLKNDSNPDIKTIEGILRLEHIIKQGKIKGSNISQLDNIADAIVDKLNKAEKAK